MSTNTRPDADDDVTCPGCLLTHFSPKLRSALDRLEELERERDEITRLAQQTQMKGDGPNDNE